MTAGHHEVGVHWVGADPCVCPLGDKNLTPAMLNLSQSRADDSGSPRGVTPTSVRIGQGQPDNANGSKSNPRHKEAFGVRFSVLAGLPTARGC